MKRIIDLLIAAALSAAAILAGTWAGDARAQAVGVNLATAHSGGGFRSWTPGAYVRTDSGLTAGILRNSYGRISLHAGQTWHTQALGLPIDLQAGLITGYQRAPVLPLATVSTLIGGRHRLILIPGPRGCAAINYSLEWK